MELTGQDNECRYCGKPFASRASLNRHVRTYCKIANSEEGMEKLMEHTLQRQLAEQRQATTQLQAQVAELAALMRGQLTLGGRETALAPPTARAPGPAIENAAQVNTGPTTNIHIERPIVTQITLAPWDGERRIEVPVAQMVAAFAENARLKEYARLAERDLTDPEIAPPYVTELFVDLTKRGHADPSARNVYLNPRRADQALAHMASGEWEVLPLAEATRLLFDGVAASIHKVARNYAELRQLPLEAQNALTLAGMVYEDEPEEYVKRAKAPIAAHLANTGPTLLGQ